jgi:hypothetical protein
MNWEGNKPDHYEIKNHEIVIHFQSLNEFRKTLFPDYPLVQELYYIYGKDIAINLISDKGLNKCKLEINNRNFKYIDLNEEVFLEQIRYDYFGIPMCSRVQNVNVFQPFEECLQFSFDEKIREIKKEDRLLTLRNFSRFGKGSGAICVLYKDNNDNDDGGKYITFDNDGKYTYSGYNNALKFDSLKEAYDSFKAQANSSALTTLFK